MSKFARSWALFKCAFQVVLENPKLLLFPIVVSILAIVIVLFFVTPLAFWNTGHSFTEAAHWKSVASQVSTWSDVPGKPNTQRVHPTGVVYLLLAPLYFVSVFLATFFNVAFFNEILHALNGQPVSIRRGLRFALTRLKAIILWSLFAGIVGLAIKALEERVGWIGQWVVRFVGIAWSVASVFVIPVMVREENHANPVTFLKTSATILRKTWGESLIGYVGLKFAGLISVWWSIAVLLPGLFLAFQSRSISVAVATGALWLVGLLALGLVLDVAGQVYRAALYIYATEGVLPGPFDQEQMDMAWKVKAGRKGIA